MKLFFKIIFIFLLILAITIGGIIYFINTNSESKALTSYIESSLSSIYPNTQASIGRLSFFWDKNDKFLDIQLNDLKIKNKKTEINVLHLPNISAKIYLNQFLKGNFIPEKLLVNDCDIILNHADIVKDQELNKSNIKTVLSDIRWHNLNLKEVSLNNINIEFNKNDRKYAWKIDKGIFNAFIKDDVTNISSAINIIRNNENSKIELIVKESKSENTNYKINFENFSADFLSDFASSNNDESNIVINGKFALEVDNRTQNLTGKFIDKNSIVLVKNHFDINLNNIVIELTDDQVKFSNSKILVNEKGEINLDGYIEFDNDLKHIKAINLTSDLKNINLETVKYIWPSSLAPYAYSWTIENIISGNIEHAYAKLDFSMKDARLNQLKDNAIELNVNFEKISANYYKNYPKIENAYGSFNINPKSMNIKINKGKIAESLISDGLIDISFDQSPIMIKGKLTGNANDIVKFVPSESVKSAKNHNIDLENIKGNANTILDLAISMNDSSENKFQVNSKLNHIGLEKLPNNYVLSEGDLDVDFNGSKTIVKGEGLLEGNPTTIEWIGDMESGDNKVSLNTNIIPKNLNNIIHDASIFTKGRINIITNIISKNNTKKIDVEAIFDQAELNLEKIGYRKTLKDKMQGKLNASIKDDKIIQIDNFHITGDNVDVAGKFSLLQSILVANEINIDYARFNGNDFKFSLHKLNDTEMIDINAKNLNLSKANFAKLFNFSGSPRIDKVIKGKINKIALRNDKYFENINIDIHCKQGFCDSTNIEGNTDDNYKFHVSTKPYDKNSSEFLVFAENMDPIYKAFDLFKNIKAGSMEIKGIHSNLNNKVIYKGNVNVKNFIVSQTPILSKLFTFTSLPKLVELPFSLLPGVHVSSNDIPFTGGKASFTLENSILNITDAAVQGPQIGLTINGNVDLAQSELYLSGTIIPELLGISKIMNNIPLLGNILQGGKGKGLVAASYSVKGNFSDPHVFVNPLSILTPGFLRNMFNIFDSNGNTIH